MRIHIYIAIVALFSISCGNLGTKKPVENSITDSKVMSKEEIRLDSIKKQEELTVFGPIRFGMNKDEFEKSKSEFEEKCKDRKIGDYEFCNINGHFYNEKLYFIEIRGFPIGYKVYDNNMKIQYEALFNVLNNKYGYPIGNRGLPEWHTIFEGDSYVCTSWLIGDKRIRMVIEEYKNDKYTLNLQVYQPSISELINKEVEVKKQNAIKKGVDVL